MKTLFIQIPCFNEAQTLPIVLAAIPKQVSGYDTVEVLVIDDGSTDDTAAIAQSLGVRHIVRHPDNRGLAQAFISGLRECERLGAHTIVNLDADNQYDAADIASLTAPILEGTAQIVIGERPLSSIKRFSPFKKLLHFIGNKVIRLFTHFKVSDATSGFRAIHACAAPRILIFSNYTYTLEMLLRLSYLRIPTTCVPIRVNEEELRPSRLIKSNWQYLRKTAAVLCVVTAIYHPMKVFLSVAGVLMLLSVYNLYHMLHFMPRGQMLWPATLAIIFASLSGLFVCTAFVCSAIHANRKLLEEIRLAQTPSYHDSNGTP